MVWDGDFGAGGEAAGSHQLTHTGNNQFWMVGSREGGTDLENLDLHFLRRDVQVPENKDIREGTADQRGFYETGEREVRGCAFDGSDGEREDGGSGVREGGGEVVEGGAGYDAMGGGGEAEEEREGDVGEGVHEGGDVVAVHGELGGALRGGLWWYHGVGGELWGWEVVMRVWGDALRGTARDAETGTWEGITRFEFWAVDPKGSLRVMRPGFNF